MLWKEIYQIPWDKLIELGRCITLDTLYMQGNFFRGHISHSMRNLRGMQNLDLSRNNLSGEIPDFFELPLKYLNLSWNHLEGEVHTKGVFANASEFSIVGNKELCGGIPELRLPRCSSDSDRSHKHKRSWVQDLFMIGFILVLLIVGYHLLPRGKKTEPPAVSIRPISVLPIRLSYKILHQATDGFSRANLVSEGGFGSVYKGELGPEYNGKAVAIKVFNQEATNSFSTECEAQQHIRHRNIVKIRSTSSSTAKKGKIFRAIVYDFMENGSLDRWQHLTCRTSPDELSMPQILNLKNRINIAIDVASALDYLHNQLDYPLIHCNLSPSNIFLDTEMSAYVSNFGLAKFLIDRRIFNGFAGPSEYAPPEYYQGSMVSTKGDVYSYGIILLEMLTGKKITGPSFHGSFKLQNFVSSVLSSGVNDVIDPFNLQELSTYDAAKANDCLVMLLGIGVRCAQESPKFRPDIKDTLRVLETIRSFFEANTGCTQTYAIGSLQAAVSMALRNRRSLLWNRLEVSEMPSPNLGETNSGRTDWNVATARQLLDPFPQMAPNLATVSYMDLHKATNGFSSANLVGAGGFGSVYKGTFNQGYVHLLLRDSEIVDEIGIAVAIKVFNLQRRGAVRSFNTECQILNNIDHKYLVKLIATCTSVDQDGHDFRAILFEFMDHGSLEMWLHPKYKTNIDSPVKPRILTLFARISIATDVALALDYLHYQCKNGIIHCDLKPGNILIDKNMSAHIADFGLAITLPKYQNMNHCSSSTGIRGTTGYIAPEYGLGCKMTTKGDTYSFGILLLEMLTGKKPTHRMFRGGLTLHNFVSLALPDNVFNITDTLMKVMTSSNTGDSKRVEDCLTRMFNIGLACSNISPKNRPDMRTVLRELESIRNSF
nr:PREDICTED: probable LRR receptor-like serine/threonine-protein kinase At3g47570 isoform X2 [Daucus carota subsp. sativus]